MTESLSTGTNRTSGRGWGRRRVTVQCPKGLKDHLRFHPSSTTSIVLGG